MTLHGYQMWRSNVPKISVLQYSHDFNALCIFHFPECVHPLNSYQEKSVDHYGKDGIGGSDQDALNLMIDLL